MGLTKEHNTCEDGACQQEGWMWADETTYSFRNWADNEPTQDEFYACLSDPGWQGIKSYNRKPYICEYGNKQNPPT